MTLSIVLDSVMLFLLTTTIAVAWILNRRLAALRQDRSQLEALFEEFRSATEKAASGISRISASTDALTERMVRAESLKDDLAFLVERGEVIADQLLGHRRSPVEAPVRERSFAIEPRDADDDDERDDTVGLRASLAGRREAPVAKKPAAPARNGARRPAPTVRSRAEQDLLAALRLVES